MCIWLENVFFKYYTKCVNENPETNQKYAIRTTQIPKLVKAKKDWNSNQIQ